MSCALRSEDGFSLVEVLVAFAILAVSLGALYSVFGTGALLSNESEKRALALMHAQSLLEAIEPDPVEEETSRSGLLDGGLRWEAVILPYGDEEDREAWTLAPYWIDVTVAWGDRDRERTLTLGTLKLRPKPI